jgi:hypothetical protein
MATILCALYAAAAKNFVATTNLRGPRASE